MTKIYVMKCGQKIVVAVVGADKVIITDSIKNLNEELKSCTLQKCGFMDAIVID